jgi:hypothetical protein
VNEFELFSLSEPENSCKGAVEFVRKEGVAAGLLGGSFYPHLRSAGLALEPCKVGADQEKFEQEKLRSEGLFKRKRIDDLKYLRRIAKSRRPLDLGEVARDLTLKAQVEPIFHRISAYRGWRVQKLHARRNRESRFPDLAGTVDRREGQVARDPTESAFRVSTPRRFIVDSRSGKSRGWTVGPHRVEYRWRDPGNRHPDSGFVTRG